MLIPMIFTLGRPVRPLVADAPAVVGHWFVDGADYAVEGRPAADDRGLDLVLRPFSPTGERTRRFDAVVDGSVSLRATAPGRFVGDWVRGGQVTRRIVVEETSASPLDGEDESIAWVYWKVSMT